MGRFPSINLIKTIILVLLFSTVSGFSQANPFGAQFEFEKLIRAEISKDDNLKGVEIAPSFLDGVVTLRGDVANLWQKKRLIKISQSVLGVKSVIDKMRIANICIESEDLGKDVALALYRDEAADVYELKVVTDDFGRVKLFGKVDSLQEEAAAMSALEKVKGVAFSKSEIEVSEEGNRSDSELRKDLEFALYDNILIDQGRLEPQVSDSRAVIRGQTGSEAETLVVERIAEGIKGIEDVNVTQLTVAPRFDRILVFKVDALPVESGDEALARAVDQANYYDTRVFSFNIFVKASDGVVVLDGVAKNESAREAAVENALNTLGVKGVVDNIRLEQDAAEQELLSE